MLFSSIFGINQKNGLQQFWNNQLKSEAKAKYTEVLSGSRAKF